MASNNLIYLADDQADYRFIVGQVFARFLPAYDLQLFGGGQALLDELAQPKPNPDLILLDHHMPQLDGHQTLLILKAHPVYKRIPVVMMSAEASALEIKDCYEAGVNSFINKQLDFQATKQAIETICLYWLETNQQPVQVY